MKAALSLLATARAAAAEVDPDQEAALAQAAPGERLPVLVSLADPVDPAAFAEGDRRVRRRALVESLRARARERHPPLERFLRARGATDLHSLWGAHALAARLDEAAIRAVARRPEVASLRLDAGLVAPAAIPASWNVAAVRAPDAWARGQLGGGAVVALLDTGADLAHPDLAAGWRGEPGGWLDPFAEHALPFDASGHGTQVLGVAVGGDASGVTLGVAPGARWIAARVFDDLGRSSYSAVHRALEWVLDPDGDPATDDAPDVVTASFWIAGKVNQCVAEFVPDLALLRAADVAIVFAAGNSGPTPASSVSPANNPGAFSVGALTRTLSPAGFSSRGPSACDGALFPTIVAPGADVRTTDPTWGGLVPEPWIAASGTSVAAPHAAGAVALLRGAWPEVTVDMMRAALVATASDCGTPGPDPACGTGRLDAARAFQWTAARLGAPR